MTYIPSNVPLFVLLCAQVLEEIRIGLEMNDFGMQQRRIAYMRFLGELYSYRLIDSPVIFDTLYLIIFFGYGTPEVLFECQVLTSQLLI